MAEKSERTGGGHGLNPLQPLLIPAIIGLSGMLLWLLCLILEHVAHDVSVTNLPFGVTGIIALAGATATVYSSSKALAPRIIEHPSKILPGLCAAAGLLSLPGLALYVDAVNQAPVLCGILEAVGWPCAGVSIGLGLLLWSNVWNILYRQGNRAYTFWGQTLCLLIVGILLVAIITFSPSGTVATILCTAAYLASLVLCWYCTKMILPYETVELRSNPGLPYKALDKRPLEDKLRMSIFCGCCGAVLVAFALSGETADFGFALPVLCLAFVYLALLVSFFVNNRIIKIYYLENISFFLLSLTLIALIVCNSVNAVLLALFITACSLEFIADFSCCILTASLKQAPFAPFMAKTFTNSFLGLIVGWSVGCAFIAFVPADYLLLALGGISLATILFDFIFIPYPVIEDDELYEYLNGLAASPKIEVKGDSQRYGGWWLYKCNAIAEECNLTKREAEILVLLAKGKNASSIAEQLVISQNTARTHIYRIYRKLGVGTHQELISFVEEKEVSG